MLFLNIFIWIFMFCLSIAISFFLFVKVFPFLGINYLTAGDFSQSVFIIFALLGFSYHSVRDHLPWNK